MPLASPAGQPHPFSKEIIKLVREYDANRPRSLQKFLGPSEIGSPCMRQIAMKLSGVPEVNQVADPWFAIIGSSVHAFMAAACEWYNDVYLGRKDNPRFLVERRTRMESAGYSTSGSSDVYDVDNARVVDWKIVGATTLKHFDEDRYWDEDTGLQYKVQAMTYGKGWTQLGYPVREVMIAGLPRSNYLVKMKIKTFAFDQSIADAAQERVAAIDRLRHLLPLEQIPAGGCTIWCPFYRPSFPLGSTSCPGHGKVTDG